MSKNDKTLAIVINTSWNIYNFRVGLLKSLQGDGYRIVTIAPHDNYSEKLKALGFEYHNININNKGTNPFEDMKLVWEFYQLYKKIKPDILLLYTIKPNIYGTIAARLAGVPVISNISGLGTVFLNNNFSSKVARLLYKIVLRIPSKVFYQNEDDRSLFVDSKLVDKDKTGLLPGSGIDTVKFSPVDVERVDSQLSFLFIARLVKDKGLVEYVEAARILKAKYPKIQFIVLGAFYPGNPTAVTEEEMAKWEQEGIVKYLGTSDDVPSLIAQSDCVVLPSYREGMSRVLLEAASMARPIVATDVPGCRDIVDDGVNGFLCVVRDPESLAKQMEKMIEIGDDRRKQMGIKGREKVIKEFDESIVITTYKKTIRNILQ